MDIGLGTKLIRYYKWKGANTDPKNTAAKAYIQMYVDDIRKQVGDMNLLKDEDNGGWTPQSETSWADAWDYSKSSGHSDISDWITQLGLNHAAGPVATSQDVIDNTGLGPIPINPDLAKSQGIDTTNIPTVTNPNNIGDTVNTYKPPVVTPPAPPSGPAYDPLAEANARFAEFQAASVRAGNNAIDAEAAYANSILNSGGIWKVLQPIANQQMLDSMAVLEKTSAIAKANVAASKAALDAQEAADYQEVIDTIDKNLVGARKRTTEDMNARGLFFSTVLDSVMGQVEAASATERGHAAGQSKARYAKIASDMAVMSGNIDIEVLKGNAAAVAQYTAQMLQVVAQDEKTKQEMAAIIAKLGVQKAGVADAIAAQIFGQKEQMRSNAIQEGFQLEDRTIAAEDRQTSIEDKAKQDWLATIGQFAGNFQAEINRISNDNDSSNDWQIPYLKAARVQKISDQLVAQAAADADKAKADALKAYQDKQLTWEEYRAVTDRINATGSATGTTKYEAPAKAGSTTTKPGGGVWTDPQARSFKLSYEKVMNMPIGTIIDSSIAADPNLVGNGVTLNVGAAWTQEEKTAFLSQNKGLYDSAMDYINQTTSTLWSTKNQQLPAPFRAMLQSMIDAGTPINTESIAAEIETYKEIGTGGLTAATDGSGGADYDYLMGIFNQHRPK